MIFFSAHAIHILEQIFQLSVFIATQRHTHRSSRLIQTLVPGSCLIFGKDEVIYAVSKRYCNHQQIGFIDGIQLGVREY